MDEVCARCWRGARAGRVFVGVFGFLTFLAFLIEKVLNHRQILMAVDT